MKRRGVIDICADILEVLRDRQDAPAYLVIEKTHMTYNRFKHYIDGLVKGGLATEDLPAPPRRRGGFRVGGFRPGVVRRSWAITEKGHEFIKRYKKLMELLPAVLFAKKGRRG